MRGLNEIIAVNNNPPEWALDQTPSGRMKYETFVQRNPCYYDGSPRPAWERLFMGIKLAWERAQWSVAS